MHPPETGGTVAAVILAAGMSRRLPGDTIKQLLVIDGLPLIRRALLTVLEASGAAPVRVVLGHRADEVRRAIDDLVDPSADVHCVVNDDYRQGQSTSVGCAVRHLTTRPDVAGAYFLPVDQPALDAAVLRRLVAAHRHGCGKIIVPTHGHRRGAPVLFDRAFFGDLLQLTGDQGGRVLLQAHRDAIYPLRLASSRPLDDIDSAEDMARWCP